MIAQNYYKSLFLLDIWRQTGTLSFASGVVAHCESLPMIGKLLGHSQVQSTLRYAHLAAEPVQAAAERVLSNIAALVDGDSAEVVPVQSRVQ